VTRLLSGYVKIVIFDFNLRSDLFWANRKGSNIFISPIKSGAITTLVKKDLIREHLYLFCGEGKTSKNGFQDKHIKGHINGKDSSRTFN